MDILGITSCDSNGYWPSCDRRLSDKTNRKKINHMMYREDKEWEIRNLM